MSKKKRSEDQDLSGFQDIPREFQSVRHRVMDKAARYALSSVLKPYAVETSEHDEGEQLQVMRAHVEVRELWRRRVLALRATGWSRLMKGTVDFARNCPEAGFWLDRQLRLRPCGMQMICPWCWCRYYVHETFLRLKYALWRTVDTPTRPPFQFDIYDCVTQEGWPLHTPVSRLYDRVERLRKQTLRKEVPHNLGAFQLFTIEPPDTRCKLPEWEIKQRLLVLVDLGAPGPPQEPVWIPGEQPADYHRNVRLTAARDEHGLTQTQLTGPIGRVCQYPSQMLRGPRDMTVELLEYRGKYRKTSEQGKRKSATGFRMSGYYGCLRNASQRKRELSMQPPLRPDRE